MDEEAGHGSGDAVDLQQLYGRVRDNRMLILKVTGAFLLLGLLAAIVHPNEYMSEAVLMPEMKTTGSDASSLLQTYGGILGLGGMSGMGELQEGTIQPEVYPMIVRSPSFIDNLLRREYYFSELDTTLTGYDYFTAHYRPNLFELVANYTIKLPSRIAGPQHPPQLPEWLMEEMELDRPIRLSDRELEIVEKLISRIDVDLNVETGVLLLAVTVPDRAASAQLNRNLIHLLKEFVEEYATQKAKEDLAFSEIQFEQAQNHFDETQQRLAEFLDKNANIQSARVRAEEQKLMAEFDIAYNRYQNVSDRLLEAKVKVQEHTPVFKTIQELNLPVLTARPNRIIMILLFVIFGLFTSFAWIAVTDVRDKLTGKS